MRYFLSFITVKLFGNVINIFFPMQHTKVIQHLNIAEKLLVVGIIMAILSYYRFDEV